MENYDYSELTKPIEERMSKLVPINSMLDEVVYEKEKNFDILLKKSPQTLKAHIARTLCINPETYKVVPKSYNDHCKYCMFGREADDGSYVCNTSMLYDWLNQEV